MLTPYRGKSDRITLIKAAGFHPEYAKLEIPIRELPAVFIASNGNHLSNGNGYVGIAPGLTNHTSPKPIPASPSRQVCKHFQKV